MIRIIVRTERYKKDSVEWHRLVIAQEDDIEGDATVVMGRSNKRRLAIRILNSVMQEKLSENDWEWPEYTNEREVVPDSIWDLLAAISKLPNVPRQDVRRCGTAEQIMTYVQARLVVEM